MYRKFIDVLSTPFEFQSTTSRVLPEDTTHPRVRSHSASSLLIYVARGNGNLHVHEEAGYRSIKLTEYKWVRIPRGTEYYIDTVRSGDYMLSPLSLFCISSPPIYSRGMGDVLRAINEPANLQTWEIPESHEPTPPAPSVESEKISHATQGKVANLSDDNFDVFVMKVEYQTSQTFEVDYGEACILFAIEGSFEIRKEMSKDKLYMMGDDAFLLPSLGRAGSGTTQYIVDGELRGGQIMIILARDRRE